MSAEGALHAGTRVEKFVVQHLIGEGGAGIVYLGLDPTVQKRVAIKVLRRALSHDESAVLRFEREARAAAELSHPAIVEIFSFGHLDDGRPYLVMSFLEGRTLRDLLERDGPLDPCRAWSIMRRVAGALQHAHDKGIVHRDVKPDNLFLQEDAPKILDFGLANLDAMFRDAATEEAMKKLTQAGMPIGTPAYMAPEQWWSEPPSPQTDQYAFGATLYELVVGHPPFRATQFAELLQAHLNTVPPSIGAALAARDGSPDATDEAMDAFFARLLSKKANERFADFDEVVREGDALFDPSRVSTGVANESAPQDVRDALAHARTVQSFDKSDLPSTRPAYAVTGGVIVGSLAGLGALGYAGSIRYDPVEWLKSAGAGVLFLLAMSAVSLWLVVRTVHRFAAWRSPTARSVAWTMLPVAPLAIATYSGWLTTLKSASTASGGQSFMILNEGMYETSANRFLGFAFVAVANLALFAGLSATGASRSERDAFALRAAALFGVTGAVVTGWSASNAAVLLVTSVLFFLKYRFTNPVADATTTGVKSLTGYAALAFTGLVAWSRLDANIASLWSEAPVRSLRVASILKNNAEIRWLLLTTFVSLASIVYFDIDRAKKRGMKALPLRFATLIVVVPLVLDMTFYVLFQRGRSEVVGKLGEQFAMFSRLTPPSAAEEGLPSPHLAPALQITSEAIALNGRAIAKLGALATPAVRQNVLRDLTIAFAAERIFEGPDVSVIAHGALPYARVAEVLAIAREAGAVDAEVLLIRGGVSSIPEGAPPETAQFLPSDFAAVKASIAPGAFDGNETFESVVRRLEHATVERGAPPILPVAASPSGT